MNRPSSHYSSGDRSVGAFRATGSIFGDQYVVTYGRCRKCGHIFESLPFSRGLGMGSRPSQEEVERERLKALNWMPLFADPNNRCVCDPAGDLELSSSRERRFREAYDAASCAPFQPAASRSTSIPYRAPNPSPHQSRVEQLIGGLLSRLANRSKGPKSNTDVQLAQLKSLLDAGVLTQDQYESAKMKLGRRSNS